MKREFKKVSIVIPTYNRLEMLKSRLGELFNQTYQNFEIIIVDDGSSDGTFDFFQENVFDKTRYIRLNENSDCVSIPRNVGICAALGEFIAPVDDDCINEPNKLEILLSNFRDGDVLVYGKRKEMSRNGAITAELECNLPNWNPMNGWGVDNSQFIFKADVFDKVPLIFPTRACDWHLAKHIYKLGSFNFVDEFVSTYIWHNENRSNSKRIYRKEPEKYINYFTNLYGYTFDFYTEYS